MKVDFDGILFHNPKGRMQRDDKKQAELKKLRLQVGTE